MAYENVNVSSLKNALSSCKSSLNYSTSNNLKSDAMNASVWDSDSKTTFNKAVNQITNYYGELESKIDHYLGLADKIQRYQDLVAENASLRSEYASLEPKLYYEVRESYNERWNEQEQRYDRDWRTVTKKDEAVASRMNAITAQISANEGEMASLDSQIQSGL